VGVLQSESFRCGYSNRYVRRDPGIGQMPNDEMTERHGFITKWTSPTSLNYRSDVGTYQLEGIVFT